MTARLGWRPKLYNKFADAALVPEPVAVYKFVYKAVVAKADKQDLFPKFAKPEVI